MIRTVSFGAAAALALSVLALPVQADETTQRDCDFQADVVAAVQAARVARVGERAVAAHVADSAPDWPEAYNAVIPLVTPWVYSLKMGQVRTADLGLAWKELCLAQ
jgi:hypothetical protein